MKLSWMNMALSQTIAGRTPAECAESLTAFISEEDTENGGRGAESIRKALRFAACWYRPAADLAAFRDQALETARGLSMPEWTPIQWAVLVANYPFVLSVSAIIGRLFNVQEIATKPQIFKRLQDEYGTQGMLERNMRYAINILVDFGLLVPQGRTGVYSGPERPFELDFDRTALLWKAILHATPTGRLPIVTLGNSPAFYPFKGTSIAAVSFVRRFPDVDFQSYSGGGEQVFLCDHNTRIA